VQARVCISAGSGPAMHTRIQQDVPLPLAAAYQRPTRPPTHLMRSSGCAWLMKKNMPAVSTPARVACSGEQHGEGQAVGKQSAYKPATPHACVQAGMTSPA
jgi:hypothetical protein